MYIIENYNRIRSHIDTIAVSCGRDPNTITLLPVSKTFPAKTVQDSIDAGLKLFGENKIQEASSKMELLQGDFSFHLIGHLQSNKAKHAVKLFDLIHSVDKLSTAKKIAREAIKIGKTQKILVQVNTSGEESKFGCTPGEALEIFTGLKGAEGLDVQGLMTIGPLTDDLEKIRASFIMLRKLRDSLQDTLSMRLPHLSMGMSGDYKIAIEEGATILRIGSAIFGTRSYPA
ncbi:MAG: YggS family pyridoxal phosphate-dependent enzyme [Spirochaetes bacterium]|nr:YggS family pyridoxal phosphate-dependent enzyme [Spirochaetota bacterium]MBN2772589.1 YggS family pyridoxal phosphate-dependent enzyme [Spirochaetota bacterium]